MLENPSFERKKYRKKEQRWIENVIPKEMEINFILRSFRFSIYRQVKTCLRLDLGLETP